MNKLILSLVAFFLLAGVSSCIKQKFDAPPVGGQDPNVVVNFSIDSLQKRYTGQPYLITDKLIVQAIVIADDKSGSFFKQLVVQDSTAGITLLMDASNLYTAYPVGRRLFINLQGLFIVSYKGTPQLAAGVNPDGTFAGLPPALFDQFIVKGSFPHPVAPKMLHIYQLNNKQIDELVEIDDVEFASGFQGQSYADGFNKISKSTTIEDCFGSNIVSYNSGYADFANSLTPTGNGKLVCIYSTYNGTPQIQIRDVTDVNMTGPRCH
ncbi:MAG: hypothetical protein JWO06_546 [Bacteroidota bacterium]|nr:hypothetical protein [Bacteroidota bacterium]